MNTFWLRSFYAPLLQHFSRIPILLCLGKLGCPGERVDGSV